MTGKTTPPILEPVARTPKAKALLFSNQPPIVLTAGVQVVVRYAAG